MKAGLNPDQVAQPRRSRSISLTTGDPLASVSQFDIEPYVQETGRVQSPI